MNLDNKKIVPLNKTEITNINGGAPSRDSSFFYDAMWVVGCVARKIGEAIENAPEYDPEQAWIHRA